MREARNKIIEYTDVIRRAMNSEDGSIAQMGCRCYYSLSRCMLLRNIKETSPVPFLIMIYEKYLQKRQEQPKPWTACVNLICGCLGRVLLTIKPRDAATYNQLRLKVQKEMNLAAMDGVKAPCVIDLVKLVGKKEKPKTDEDDMF